MRPRVSELANPCDPTRLQKSPVSDGSWYLVETDYFFNVARNGSVVAAREPVDEAVVAKGVSDVGVPKTVAPIASEFYSAKSGTFSTASTLPITGSKPRAKLAGKGPRSSMGQAPLGNGARVLSLRIAWLFQSGCGQEPPERGPNAIAAVIASEGRQCGFMRLVDGFDTCVFRRLCCDA